MFNKIIKKLVLLSFSASLLSHAAHAISPTKEPPAHSHSYNTRVWPANTKDVLKMLEQDSVSQLSQMKTQADNELHAGWYALAIIAKEDSKDTKTLGTNLLDWRALYPSHPANQLLPSIDELENMTEAQSPQQIAVLLPESGTYSELAKKIRQGIMDAYYQNAKQAGQQNIKFYDTAKIDVTTAYQLASDEGADIIIGPLQKEQVLKIRKLNNIQIPTLALNYSDKNDSEILPDNFFEFGLLPEDEAAEMAEHAYQSEKSHALVIAPDTELGKRLVTAFTRDWQTMGGNVQDTWYFNSKTDLKNGIAHLLKIDMSRDKKLSREHSKREILEKQRRQDFDVVFVFSEATQARAIIPMLRYYYVRDIPVYATSSILDQSQNSIHDKDFDHVVVCSMPTAKKKNDHLYSLGEDAYQLSVSLNRLIGMPDFPVYGATGTLTMHPNHQIHRGLLCHAIKNGNTTS